ncbi:hypothetical protein SAMN04488097_3156 [Epilithonimonas lactis]|nr:hypothetical protein SAMN04488097_3156 [Epilithonimonas lactis]
MASGFSSVSFFLTTKVTKGYSLFLRKQKVQKRIRNFFFELFKMIFRIFFCDFCGSNHTSNFALFNLKELRITETELKLIAAAAIIGLNKMPKKG